MSYGSTGCTVYISILYVRVGVTTHTPTLTPTPRLVDDVAVGSLNVITHYSVQYSCSGLLLY